MVLYVVNITIKKEHADEWIKWMREIHIPNVLATGYFTKADMYSQILPAIGGDYTSFSIQYTSESYEKFMSYTVKESKRLQKEHAEKFGSVITAQRYVYETL